MTHAIAEALAPSLSRRQLALAFTAILHLSALGCIVLLHVHAPLLRPEPPPLEVVMITPPERLPDPLPAPLRDPQRPPLPAAEAAPRPQAAPAVMPPKPVAQPAQARPLPAVPAAPQAPEPPPAAASPSPASIPNPAPAVPALQPVAPALDPVARPAAPAGAATPQTAPATASARAPSVVPPSFDADYLHNPPPRYPPAAARLRESGRVLLSVVVNAAGLPERVEIASSSGSPRLDQAALDTVKRWRFVPARQGDKAVAASVTVPLVFRLDEQAP